MSAVLRVKMDETDMMIALMFVAYLAGCLVAVWIVEKWEQSTMMVSKKHGFSEGVE